MTEKLIVLPNPALKGGELQVAAMQGAKQTLYVEQRRKHREAFQKSLVDCGCPACMGILRDPMKETNMRMTNMTERKPLCRFVVPPGIIEITISNGTHETKIEVTEGQTIEAWDIDNVITVSKGNDK